MTESEIRSQREKCGDCGGALQEVKVLDSTGSLPVRYYSDEPRKSIWIGEHYTVEGIILAFRCSRCARISFYGAANEP